MLVVLCRMLWWGCLSTGLWSHYQSLPCRFSTHHLPFPPPPPRLDAYYELGLGGCWDLCAAVLVLEEAGGRVLDPAGGPLLRCDAACSQPLCCVHPLCRLRLVLVVVTCACLAARQALKFCSAALLPRLQAARST